MNNSSTMAYQSMAMQGFGAVASMLGTYYDSKQQNTLLDLQADISSINARVAEANARSELLAGQRRVQASKMRTASVKGSQRAAMAANGLDLGVGSALELQTSTDLVGEVDANALAADAIRSAWGYRMQGAGAQNDATMRRASMGAPGADAASSLLTGAGTVARSWYRFKQAGAFDSGQKFAPPDGTQIRSSWGDY